ncbi:hypothetical protein DFH08DRAFT_824285 [Mycena albidolilacea]|uniref:Secreted protein n=1 Tax=Mycena albidolilacea TaxID=1033008 RepID=A0AAD6Z480_9AGAR|nr:hypothetical protein DFH08DRAFT_824285 [Mycena albidolilacea]
MPPFSGKRFITKLPTLLTLVLFSAVSAEPVIVSSLIQPFGYVIPTQLTEDRDVRERENRDSRDSYLGGESSDHVLLGFICLSCRRGSCGGESPTATYESGVQMTHWINCVCEVALDFEIRLSIALQSP